MRNFLRSLRRGSSQGAAEAQEVHSSLALPWIWQTLGKLPTRRLAVLDLGPAMTANLEFFGRLGYKLHIADFYSSLRADGAPPTAPLAEEDPRWQRFFPYPEDTRFDLILTWDVFNYLSPEEIRALAAHLSRYCHPHGLWHSMIHLHGSMPSRPLRFTLLDGERLAYERAGSGQRPGPGYREPFLLRHLPGLCLRKTFLLRHGIQEYVFQFT